MRDFKPVLERALKTFAQTLAAIIVADAAVTITDVDWPVAVGTAALAALLSVLTSLGSWGRGKNAGPSLAGERLDDE